MRSGALDRPESYDQNQFATSKPQHVHSDSIMSAQFQPEQAAQIFSHENLQLKDQQRLLETRSKEHQVLSEKDRYENERDMGGRHYRPSAGLRSPGSFDRKTFTLGDKGGQPGMMSKTDVLSLPYNQLTSPTDQNA